MSKKNKTKITASPTKENTTAKIKKSVTDYNELKIKKVVS